MIAQGNVTHIVVGKDDNIATSRETRDSLVAGMIGVFLVGSTVGKTDALAAGNKFQVVYKRTDGAIISSPVIEYNNIISKNATTYVADTERIRALGFNGTTGSIDVTNSEDYVVHYNWYDDTKTFSRGKPVKFIAYRSSTAATQVEIANGLAKSVVQNNSKEIYPVIKVDLLINSAGIANAATAGADFTHLKFTKGSKYVVGVDSSGVEMLGSDELIDTIVAGDYLRAGTAVTDTMYKITAVTNGTGTTPNGTALIITLDYAYQGTTALIAVGSTEYVAAATAATADAGIKLTAQSMPFDPGKKVYSKVEFKFWKVGEGFGSTTVSELAAPSKGKGTYKEIAEVEWFLRGNRGETFRVADYPVSYTADATSGKTYNQIAITYKDTNAHTLDRDVASYGGLLIATEVDSSGTPHASLKTVFGL